MRDVSKFLTVCIKYFRDPMSLLFGSLLRAVIYHTCTHYILSCSYHEATSQFKTFKRNGNHVLIILLRSGRFRGSRVTLNLGH